MTPFNTWTIEYSHSEDTFRIGRTTEMLRRNIQSIQTGQQQDFICVGIFSNREQALEAMLDFRRKRIPGWTMALAF